MGYMCVPSRVYVVPWKRCPGLVFRFADGSKQTLGRQIYYKPPDYSLIIPPNETIKSVTGRSGDWLDGIQFELTDGTKSPYIGGPNGSPFEATPPSVGHGGW